MITARASLIRMVQSSLVLALLATTSVELDAQRRQDPPARLMVATFQSADRELRTQAPEALRNRLERDVGQGPRAALRVIPRVDINTTLQNSGYAVDEVLAPNDAKALANLLRADEYVEGTVTRTPAGNIRIDARLVLARDNTVTQVLRPAEHSRVDGAVAQVSREILQARRQTEAEAACAGALRVGDAPRAIGLAERGLQQNTEYNDMIKVCLATAYVARDTQEEGHPVVTPETLALVEEILASDRRNIPALRMATVGYRAASERARDAGNDELAEQNEDKYVTTLTALVAADPSDLRTQEQVVNELAASGRASVAVPIIMDALGANPGDPRMLRTGWLVLLAAQDFERAIPVGEELVRVDTAAATADYFRRLAAAHTSRAQQLARGGTTAADTQSADAHRQRALQVFEAGTARFPQDAALLAFHSQALREAGQPQRAAEAAQRALAIDPANNDARVQLIQAHVAANNLELAGAAIREAGARGVDRGLLSQLALKLGNDAYRAGQASRQRSDYEAAIRFLQLSNELESSLDAQFLLGASAFSLGAALTQEAQETRSCQMTRQAQETFATARTNLIAGQSRYPEPAAQLLDAIGQFTTPLGQMVRAYCR